MWSFYFLIFSFIFVATFSLSITKVKSAEKTVQSKVEESSEIRQLPPLPVLKTGALFPDLSSQSVLAIDVDSGVTLYEKNSGQILLPASTTKIATALVALDYFPLDYVIEVKDISVVGQKMGLVDGEKIAVRDLLYGLLIFSANDAAEVLAQNYPGGRDSFIQAMNFKVKELHLENTFFNNPSGLEGQGHVTTSRDLVRLAQVAMKNPLFKKIVGTKEIVVKSVDGKFTHKLVNLNELIGEVDGVLGVKTGWTENARENLVTYLERDDKKIVIVVLGSQDRFNETKEIISWIFENYEWKNLSSQN